ncbi:MAG: hypothetical protein R2827_04845 [Bdellovibrionales bacterium]
MPKCFKHIFVTGLLLVLFALNAFAEPRIYSVELETQNEKHTTEGGETISVRSVINVAEVPYAKDIDSVKRQDLLISWARKLLEKQWDVNPGAPVEIVVIPKSDLQENIENMGDEIHQSSWLRRRVQEF